MRKCCGRADLEGNNVWTYVLACLLELKFEKKKKISLVLILKKKKHFKGIASFLFNAYLVFLLFSFQARMLRKQEKNQ